MFSFSRGLLSSCFCCWTRQKWLQCRYTQKSAAGIWRGSETVVHPCLHKVRKMHNYLILVLLIFSDAALFAFVMHLLNFRMISVRVGTVVYSRHNWNTGTENKNTLNNRNSQSYNKIQGMWIVDRTEDIKLSCFKWRSIGQIVKWGMGQQMGLGNGHGFLTSFYLLLCNEHVSQGNGHYFPLKNRSSESRNPLLANEDMWEESDDGSEDGGLGKSL